MSAPSPGAEISTFFAPAEIWPEAFSLLVKMPVHSMTMSTPRLPQGSLAMSRSASTLIGPLPTSITSPSSVTLPAKRPCTLS